MDSEKPAFWEAVIKLLLVVVFAILYCIGGWGFLFLRRYVAPVELVAGMMWFSRDWRCLFNLAGIGALCLGYSGHDLFSSIWRRGLFGFTNGVAFSIGNLLNKRFLLAAFQIILVPATTICFGVWNPFPSARMEELVIGFEIAFIPMMSASPRK